MLPLFPHETKPREYEEILRRLKLLREIIGAEIDKIKLGVSPEFPKEWLERVKIDYDNDTEEEIAEKLYRNSLVICKKPYFQMYVYDTLRRSYIQYMKTTNVDCEETFGMKFKDLMYKKDKTHKEQKYVNKVNYFSPVLDSNCTMNKICHKFEALEREIKYDKDFEYSVLPEFNNKCYKMMKTKIDKLEIIYKKYKARRKYNYLNNLLDGFYNADDLHEMCMKAITVLRDECVAECNEQVSTNYEELFEYMMALRQRYIDTNRKFNMNFVWDILGEDILKIIPSENQIMYLRSDSPTDIEYLGEYYIRKVVE